MDKEENITKYKDLYIASENLRKYANEERLHYMLIVEKIKKVLKDG